MSRIPSRPVLSKRLSFNVLRFYSIQLCSVTTGSVSQVGIDDFTPQAVCIGLGDADLDKLADQ